MKQLFRMKYKNKFLSIENEKLEKARRIIFKPQEYE